MAWCIHKVHKRKLLSLLFSFTVCVVAPQWTYGFKSIWIWIEYAKKRDWNIFDYNEFNHKRFTIIFVHWKKRLVCLITPTDFLSIQPFMRPLFSGQQELSNLDYDFQDGWKTGAQTNQRFWKLENIFWWSKVSHIIIKGWNFMIKSFSGQVVFCFAILRAISAYVGENWLSQYRYIRTVLQVI